MRRYFAPDTLSFPKAELVEAAKLRFPVVMNIEPTLRCNANCIMCPRTMAQRPVGDMEFGLYARIVAEMAEKGPVKVVNYHKDGEPLLHPRLEDMIALAKRVGACEFTHFNTNALALDEERARKLLDCGIDDITMSIDAVTPETFRRVKGLGAEHFAAVQRNVERLMNLREQKGQKTPWVRAKLCAIRETEHEIDAFLQRWDGMLDETQVQEGHNYGGGKDYMPAQAGRYPCQCWWSTLAVNWDGTVSICAVDFSGEVLLGDLKQQSIADIYHGRTVRNYRRAMLAGDWQAHALCARCTVWQVGPDQSEWYGRLGV